MREEVAVGRRRANWIADTRRIGRSQISKARITLTGRRGCPHTNHRPSRFTPPNRSAGSCLHPLSTTSVLRLPPLRVGGHSDRRRFQRQHRHQRHCPPSDGTRHRSHVALHSPLAASASATVASVCACQSGLVIERATVAACWCWPARRRARTAPSCAWPPPAAASPCRWEQARCPPEPGISTGDCRSPPTPDDRLKDGVAASIKHAPGPEPADLQTP